MMTASPTRPSSDGADRLLDQLRQQGNFDKSSFGKEKLKYLFYLGQILSLSGIACGAGQQDVVEGLHPIVFFWHRSKMHYSSSEMELKGIGEPTFLAGRRPSSLRPQRRSVGRYPAAPESTEINLLSWPKKTPSIGCNTSSVEAENVTLTSPSKHQCKDEFCRRMYDLLKSKESAGDSDVRLRDR